jgi:hypothetical protein
MNTRVTCGKDNAAYMTIKGSDDISLLRVQRAVSVLVSTYVSRKTQQKEHKRGAQRQRQAQNTAATKPIRSKDNIQGLLLELDLMIGRGIEE